MRKVLTIAGISLLSGTALARAPEPTIEINIDVLQGMVPPPAAEVAPAYKPSVEKPLVMPKQAKPCHKPKKPKKKKAKKAKVEKSLPSLEVIKPIPEVIVPIEVAPPAPAPIVEEVKPAEDPVPAPVVAEEAPKATLKDRILAKLRSWKAAFDSEEQKTNEELAPQPVEEPTPPAVVPVETAPPVEAAPPVGAPKAVEEMKVEKPQEPVPAPQKVEEVKPEPFVIPAEEAPVEAAPIANDLAPQPEEAPVVEPVEEPKKESIFQRAVHAFKQWRESLRAPLEEEKPAEEALPDAPPPAVTEPEKPKLPEAPPVAEPKEIDMIEKLPDAPPAAKQVVLPEAPPAANVAPQNILPDVPPVPASVQKNTGALYVIPFAADSDEIKLEEQGYLLALAERLKQEENMRVAVQGFAPLNNGQEYEARRLSLKRAVGVRQFLMDKGIDPTRVNVQALGSATEESLKDRVDILRIN